MKPDTHNLEARIDKDKREREKEIAFLLLGLYALAARRAEDAIRVGADPYGAIAGVVMGNAALNMRGGTERLAALLLLAEFDGFRRTKLVMPGEDVEYRPANYQSFAAQSLAQSLGTLQRLVAIGLSKSRGVTESAAAIKYVFRKWGYTKDGDSGPWRVRNAAATLVAKAYGRGYWAGWQRPDVKIDGFFYQSILDARTSDICRKYQRVKLPQDHPWWLSHWPPNHNYCRSVVIPIVGEYVATDDPPFVPPPEPGFGTIDRAGLIQFARTTKDRVDALGRKVA